MNYSNFFRLIQLSLCMVAAAAVVSCRKDVPAVTEPEDGRKPFSFMVQSPMMEVTKGQTGLSLETLRVTGFGVSAYWRDDKGFFDGVDDSHVYFKNHMVSFLENIGTYDRWRLSPVEYWPLRSSLSFFGYAPYMPDSDPMLKLPTDDSVNLPRGRFTQRTDVSSMVDFCLAVPALDRTAEQGDVPLIFNHALTQVRLYVNVKGVDSTVPNLKYRLEQVRWKGLVGENSFTYGGTGDGFLWDNLPRTDLAKRDKNYTLTMAAGQLSDSALPEIGYYETPSSLSQYLFVNGTEKGTMYLLPQPLTSNGEVMLFLKGYTVSGGTWTPYEDREPITIKLPVETVWKPGTIVTYTTTIDVTNWKEIDFNVTLTPWGEANKSILIPVS